MFNQQCRRDGHALLLAGDAAFSGSPTYTPAQGKAAAPKAYGLIYRGCTARAVIEPTAAPTMTRSWLGYSYQLAF